MRIFNLQFSIYKERITKKGFTLLELLVVISIISILVALGASSYSTAQKKARDAQRKGDLRSIGSAYEQYYSVCGSSYPSAFTRNVVCTSPSIAIMPTTSYPKEPKGTPYACFDGSSCTASMYKICATLESESPAQYCVNSQQ